KVGPLDVADPPPAQHAAHDAVVVQHDLAVGGQPGVALEPGGAQAQPQPERLDGVLGSMRARTAVGEQNGRSVQGWIPGGHHTPCCQPPRVTVGSRALGGPDPPTAGRTGWTTYPPGSDGMTTTVRTARIPAERSMPPPHAPKELGNVRRGDCHGAHPCDL